MSFKPPESRSYSYRLGLYLGDGCITGGQRTKLPSGRVAEYAYPRYFFSNMSADIRALFCEYCKVLGIRWTRSDHRNISVSHRQERRGAGRVRGA